MSGSKSKSLPSSLLSFPVSLSLAIENHRDHNKEMDTRAAKRSGEIADLAQNQSPKKKRVVLGELPNLSNSILQPQKLGCRRMTMVKNAAMTKKILMLEESELDDTKVKAKKALFPDKNAGTDEKLDDPQNCQPYVSDIYEYLRKIEMEPKRRPMHGYLEKIQKDVSANMRGILIDWLVEVAEEYKLLSDTLYLSVSYIDRFLSTNPVSRQRLQLLGVSSMLIASKYEEISPPHVEEFCYITDNTYTKAEVVQMEADILKSLNFEMGNPTVNTFLRRFAGFVPGDQKFKFLVYYLAELSLLDYNCIKFLPSLVAASVIFLARLIISPKMHPWTSVLQECLGYKSFELKGCVLMLHDMHLARRGGSLRAIRDKYKQLKFKYVATLPSPLEIPVSYFEEP